ncbi:MAG: hypothetical protein GEEBNDBF_01190 [bacterium]|nr:hypothetical protein [bacterium]
MFLLTALLSVVFVLSITGCAGNRHATLDRRGASDPSLTILIAEAPEPDAELTDGLFYIRGQVRADLGLSSTTPLLLQEYHLTTGLWCTPTNVLQVSAWNDAFSFDPETGLFEIGIPTAAKQLVLMEGEQEVYLIARDSADNTAEWAVKVSVPPQSTPTLAEVRSGRERWGSELAPLFSTYADMLATLEFDPSAFPHIGLDRQAAATLAQRLTTILSDPTTRSWRDEGLALEAELTALVQEYNLSTVAEPFLNRVGWWRWHLELSQDIQSGLLGHSALGYDDLEARAPMRRGLLAYFQHSYANAGWATGGNASGQATATWEATIWQDTGAPHFLDLASYDPQQLVANSGSSTNPVWQLRVICTDTDNDGDYDEVEAEGLSDGGAMSGAPAAFTDSESYGHPIVFLRHVFSTRAIGITGY